MKILKKSENLGKTKNFTRNSQKMGKITPKWPKNVQINPQNTN